MHALVELAKTNQKTFPVPVRGHKREKALLLLFQRVGVAPKKRVVNRRPCFLVPNPLEIEIPETGPNSTSTRKAIRELIAGLEEYCGLEPECKWPRNNKDHDNAFLNRHS